MPTYSMDEAREQARKAAAYFAGVLGAQGAESDGGGVIAVRDGGTVFVVATGPAADRLEAAMDAFPSVTVDRA